MAKAPSPLLGYNNNVRHKNRVFHIQTEDSGIKHPHIITHLFMDGGRILKSVKKSYADVVGSEGMSDLVRQMMKEQHKAMFIALRDGQFDHLIEAAVNGIAPVHPSAAPSSSSVVAAAPASPPSPPVDGESAVDLGARAPSTAGVDGTIPAPPPSVPVSVHVAPVSSDAASPPTTREPPPLEATASAPADDSLTLDIDALERAHNEPAARPAFRSNHDLPPPPANLFKKPDTGRYRDLPRSGREEVVGPPAGTPSPTSTGHRATPGYGSVPRPAQQQQQPPQGTPAPVPRPGSQQRPAAAASSSSGQAGTPSAPGASGRVVPPPPPSAPGPSEGRYAPARPAAIFGQARPQQGSSIFGEDLISDKSLDEVILSYLAEDLEGEKK